MSSYYYALASLPYLQFEGDRYPELEDFIEISQKWGSANESLLLEDISLEPDLETLHPLLKRYAQWEVGLRNELVRQRAALQERDGQAFIVRDQGGDDYSVRSGLSEAVRTALNAESPLKADEILDQLRWNFLDELEVGHFYDLEQMIVYVLKLHILLRRRAMTRDAGRASFERHYSAVRERMEQSQNMNGEQA